MRSVVVAVVAACIGCGPSVEEQRALERADCCACLEELACMELSAERCEKNLDDGGTVEATIACVEDRSRCGTACAEALGSPIEG